MTLRRLNKSNIYETDYDLLYTTDDFVEEEPIKTRHIDKKKLKRQAKLASIAEKQAGICITKKQQKEEKTKSHSEENPIAALFGKVISSVPVECACNKCKSDVMGDLVSSTYSPICDLEIPFVRYECRSCGHVGYRTVSSKGLPPKQFEQRYF